MLGAWVGARVRTVLFPAGGYVVKIQINWFISCVLMISCYVVCIVCYVLCVVHCVKCGYFVCVFGCLFEHVFGGLEFLEMGIDYFTIGL